MLLSFMFDITVTEMNWQYTIMTKYPPGNCNIVKNDVHMQQYDMSHIHNQKQGCRFES